MVATALPALACADLCQRLRAFSQVNLQAQWRVYRDDLPIAQAVQPDTWKTWEIPPLNDRQHIAWDAGKQVLWLGQVFTVPANLQGYTVLDHQIRLDLTWWADHAQIFVNGVLVQEGDLFDCVTKLRLADRAVPGEVWAIALRLTSPGHDRGALVLSQIRFEAIGLGDRDCPEPGFVADELMVLGRYLQGFKPEAMGEFEAALEPLQGLESGLGSGLGSGLESGEQIVAVLRAVRDRLLPFSPFLKQRQVSLLGHAHLDMAWLWPVADTWEAAERTFVSALQLQEDYPELIFGHSSPALYAWLQVHRPELWQRVKTAINQNQWEVIAGLWIEPDCIVPNGESLIRQVLYGQRYVEQQLGVKNRIAWLPDSFGFCNQLPQILTQGGINYFVTEKLLWNDTTEFPYQLFEWQSPDGTRITSYMSARIGTQIDPVQMAEYACQWEQSTGIAESLWLPGVGDHGGGPTREMLETAARWGRSPFFPRLEFAKAHDYLDRVRNTSGLPVWNQDLYLEYHRGCYTTHADQKRYNRRAEALLYQAELFASLATIATGASYPKQSLETLWKTVLFNQFHDILPGSSIAEVFVDANRDWEVVMIEGQGILERALGAIAQHIQLPNPPLSEAIPFMVFNPLNWERSEILEIEIGAEIFGKEVIGEELKDWEVCDRNGQPLSTQPTKRGTRLIDNYTIAGVGYETFWLTPRRDELRSSNAGLMDWGRTNGGLSLRNGILRVEIDLETGDLISVFSEILDRELLSAPGNQLQAFRDQGQYWDAWNIDPDYANHPLAGSELISIEPIEQGPLEWRTRIIRRISNSICKHDYILHKNSDTLVIETEIDWQADQVLLKTAFPLALEASNATYETPCGTICRTTKPQTDAERAQWEVPALRWANLTDDSGAWGVSLLNDCKYGYDAQPNQLRLTLLRSSNWPEVGCDRGLQKMTYALHAHSGTVNHSQTVERGYELQIPLQIHVPSSASEVRTLSSQGTLLNLGSNSLVLSALKQSEDHPNQWIARCYEAKGQVVTLRLSSDLGIQAQEQRDGLEEKMADENAIARFAPEVSPWEILTFSWEDYGVGEGNGEAEVGGYPKVVEGFAGGIGI